MKLNYSFSYFEIHFFMPEIINGVATGAMVAIMENSDENKIKLFNEFMTTTGIKPDQVGLKDHEIRLVIKAGESFNICHV